MHDGTFTDDDDVSALTCVLALPTRDLAPLIDELARHGLEAVLEFRDDATVSPFALTVVGAAGMLGLSRDGVGARNPFFGRAIAGPPPWGSWVPVPSGAELARHLLALRGVR